MREILFRGKRVSDGEWVEGWLSQTTIIPEDGPSFVGLVINAPYEKPFDAEWHIIDPATVGQYTGLTDRNGKKIFEGDILAMKGIDKLIIEGVVRYGTFNCTCCQGVYGWFVDGGDIRDAEYMCEVIGNEHDNPELLEVVR